MHAGLLDVLHDAADDHLAGAVADGVDVDLGGVLEEAVDEHRALGGQAALAAEAAEAGQLVHRPGQRLVVVDDLHGPAAEHVGRAHQHRVADLRDDGLGLLERGGGAAGRLRDLEPGAQRVPALAVLGQVDRLGRRAEHEPLGQQAGELERGLAAEAHDHAHEVAGGLLGLDHVEHVLERERLEVEAVGGVVVGRHGLGVAVDHHRLEAGVATGRSWRARSSSRTRCPGRCGSGRSRGSAPSRGPDATTSSSSS